MADSNNKRVAFTQQIDERSHKRFNEQHEVLEKYATKHGIKAPSKGDFLSRIFMKPETMDMPPEEYFN